MFFLEWDKKINVETLTLFSDKLFRYLFIIDSKCIGLITTLRRKHFFSSYSKNHTNACYLKIHNKNTSIKFLENRIKSKVYFNGKYFEIDAHKEPPKFMKDTYCKNYAWISQIFMPKALILSFYFLEACQGAFICYDSCKSWRPKSKLLL